MYSSGRLLQAINRLIREHPIGPNVTDDVRHEDVSVQPHNPAALRPPHRGGVTVATMIMEGRPFSSPAARNGRDQMLFNVSREYRRYLHTDVWKRRSKAAKDRAGGRCESCGRHPAEITRHINYEHLGYESPEDLI